MIGNVTLELANYRFCCDFLVVFHVPYHVKTMCYRSQFLFNMQFCTGTEPCYLNEKNDL
jgi:hypothetical protein